MWGGTVNVFLGSVKMKRIRRKVSGHTRSLGLARIIKCSCKNNSASYISSVYSFQTQLEQL